MRRIGLAVILAVGLFAAVILAVGLFIAGKHSPFKVNAIKSDAPLAIQAQPERRKPRIAVLFNATPIAEISGPNPKQSSMRAFLDGMRAEGWIDGQNITIERRSAEGHVDRYVPLAQEMVNLKAEVVVVTGAPPFVLAAQQATRTIPIVMVGFGGNFVTLGLAKSFASPGGNVTGSTFMPGPGLGSKWLELLKEVSPKISRVAVLYRTDREVSRPDTSTENAARALGITLFRTPIDSSQGISADLAGIAQQRPNALLVGTVVPRLREIIEFAAIQRLPAIYNYRGYVEAGGLMSYGADWDDLFRHSASYVSKILKGAKPANLPIVNPTAFKLVINLKTAKALGLTIPQSVLVRADQVIE
jgi:putative ABC transport system substrate-binding protein